MTRSHLLSLRALLPAALFLAAGVVVGVGCGGGGGGGGGNDNGGGTTPPVNNDPTIAHVTSFNQGSSNANPSALEGVAPTATQAGSSNAATTTFTVRDGTHVLRVTVPATRFRAGQSFTITQSGSSTATYQESIGGTVGTWQATGGTVTVTKAVASKASVNFSGLTFSPSTDATGSFTLSVTTTGVAVSTASNSRGIVRSVGGLRLVGATVAFYNATSNTPLATVVTDANGLIPDSAPANATRFSVSATGATSKNITTGQTVAASYYSRYFYNGKYYDAGAKCLSALPDVNSNVGFTTDVVFTGVTSGTPPPGPGNDGCVGPTG